MHTLSITLPDDLYDRVKRLVPQRRVSKFVAHAIEEKLDQQREELYLAYLEASKDQEREAEIQQWSHTDVETWE